LVHNSAATLFLTPIKDNPMKKIYLLLTILISVSNVYSQTANAVVFSELGEKFTFYLNGEKQNAQPQVNVKMSGLTSEFYQSRVDFEDASIADFANNNFAVQKGLEVTYIIKKNKKGENILRFSGQSEISATAVTPVTNSQPIDSEVRRISEVDKTEQTSDNVTINSRVKETNGGSSGDVHVVETTTTTTNKPNTANGEKVTMGINIGGVNMGVNVDVQNSGMDVGVEENSSTTVTKTTTTKTTSSTTAIKPKEEIIIVESVNGCSTAMSTSNFNSAKTNITSKGFDETKLSTAKTIVKANCMTAEQIKTICMEFGFDESRLTFAKYAYDYCTDKNNYFVVKEAFSFSSSTDELNEYLESK